jgi:hypothetical protein
MFPAKPIRKQISNEPNTATDALLSITPGRDGREDGSVFHFLSVTHRTDGRDVVGLRSDYPYRVARGSSASGTVSATVGYASEEYNLDQYPSMVFELDLKYQGMKGKGPYWASVKNGLTYQAYTWCLGSSAPACRTYHDEFLNTVRY